MFATTCPPVGTAVDTVPGGAMVIGMLTGDLLGTRGLWRVMVCGVPCVTAGRVTVCISSEEIIFPH